MITRTLGAIEARKVKQINATVDTIVEALAAARKRIDIGQEQGLSETFLSAMEIDYRSLLSQVEGLADQGALVSDDNELRIWNDRAAQVEARVEALNAKLIQEVPGELSKRNWRIAGQVVGGTVLIGSVLWVLWWVSKTWWVGRR